MNQDEDAALGLGLDDMPDDGPPDFKRGAGGAPKFRSLDGEKFVTGARASSLGDALDSKEALRDWIGNRIMDGMAARPELAAAVLAAEDDDRKTYAALREKAIDAGRGARGRDIGSAVHKMSERWEQDDTFDPGEPFRSALEAYTDALADVGLKSQLYECKVVNYDAIAAGTFDRLWETTEPLITPTGEYLPAGSLLIGDLKTGSLTYSLPVYCVQSAVYAGGQLYDVVRDEVLPTPDINQDWGIIAHLDVEAGTCELIWLDLSVGRAGIALANDVREWRRGWRRKNGFRAACVQVQRARTENPPEALSWRPEKVETEVTDDQLRDFTRQRINGYRGEEQIVRWVKLRWPKNVPPPKNADREQLLEINRFLDSVDAEFGVGFPENDPRPAMVQKS